MNKLKMKSISFQGEDLDNEIQPKQSTSTFRPTKKRLSPSFKNLELKNRKATTLSVTPTVSRTTSTPTKEPKDHKFHAKFNSKNKGASVSKPFNSVATKSLTFNRKNKDNEKYSINKTRNAGDTGSNRVQVFLIFLWTNKHSISEMNIYISCICVFANSL